MPSGIYIRTPQPLKSVEEYIGRTYNFLTVIGDAGRINNERQLICKCICGVILPRRKLGVVKGLVRSCGCMKTKYSHGMHGTKIYGVWAAMVRRCKAKKSFAYSRYGGRGISVCKKWESFAGFYEDMNIGYMKGLTLDRIDNNKGYYKENCRWVDHKEQARNRNNTVILSIKGKKERMPDVAERVGINYEIIRRRLKRGWPHEEAVSIPPLKSGQFLKNKNKWQKLTQE